MLGAPAGAAAATTILAPRRPPRKRRPGLPSGSTAGLRAGVGRSGRELRCRVDGAPLSACASPFSPGVLADGSHTLTASDGDTTGVQAFDIDGTPPQGLSVVQPQDGAVVTTAAPRLEWRAASDAHPGVYGVWYRVGVDGAEVTPRIFKWFEQPCPCRGTGTLPDGPRTWRVSAIDALANESAPVGGRFTVAAPPEARIAVTGAVVLSRTRIRLDASQSTDNGPGTVTYAWAPRGRGRFGKETRSARIARRYPAGVFRPAVRVTDAGGRSSVAGTRLEVRRRPPKGRVGISVNRGAERTKSRRVTLLPVWPAFAKGMLISNDGGFRMARSFKVKPRVRWTLPATRGRVARTVYVRFVGGPLATDRVYGDDIVLDRRRSAGVRPPRAAPRSRGRRRSRARGRAPAAPGSSAAG